MNKSPFRPSRLASCLAALLLGLAGCAGPLQQSASTLLPASAKPFAASIDLSLPLSGSSSARSLSGASSVRVSAFNSSWALVGTGSLSFSSPTGSWKGELSVSETGLQTFEATALGSTGEPLYFGTETLLVGGGSNSLSIAVSTPASWSVTNLSNLSGNSATNGLYWSSIALSADGTKLAATDDNPATFPHKGNIWMSSDSGTTWTNVSTLSGNSGVTDRWWQSIAMSADGTKIAAVVNTGGVWVSTDSGASWTDASSQPGGAGTAGGWWGTVTMSADGTKLAMAAWSGDIWTSLDSGTTWTDASTASGSNLTPGLGWHSLAMSADGTKIAAAQESANGGDVSLGDIWTSSDSGLTWINSTSVAGVAGMRWMSVASSSDGAKLAAVETTTNHIWTSSDSGSTWTNVTASASFGSHAWVWISSSADGTRLMAVDNSSNTAVSFDSGANWALVSWGSSGMVALRADGTKFVGVKRQGALWSGVLGLP